MKSMIPLKRSFLSFLSIAIGEIETKFKVLSVGVCENLSLVQSS